MITLTYVALDIYMYLHVCTTIYIAQTDIYRIYTPYAGAAGILLHLNGKFTTGKFNHL